MFLATIMRITWAPMESASVSTPIQPNVAPRETSVENADLHSSSDEYARRFGGPIGTWMLQVQEDSLFGLLAPDLTTFLDIGGGHGQIALPLAEHQKSVTVMGSSPACAQRLQEWINTGAVSFTSGNLVALPFNNRSFDAVVTFRLMSHCTAWRTLVAEMCRVADRAVIFDYPIWCSSNFLTPILFRIKRRIEGNTRTYRIFTTRELAREFRAHGFVPTGLRKQFFFPMGVHRALRTPWLSRSLETLARVCGLTRLFGSPVIIRFERSEGYVR